LSDKLFDLIAAVRAEFGVRTGRNEWLNIATVGDLHEHLATVLRVRGEEARANLWACVAAVVGRVFGVAPEQVRPESDSAVSAGALCRHLRRRPNGALHQTGPSRITVRPRRAASNGAARVAPAVPEPHR
jgi:hypothetical protein